MVGWRSENLVEHVDDLSGAARPDDAVIGPRPDGEHRSRRPYETPRLIRYGHVKELTAGAKPGTSDIALAGSLAGSIV